MKNEIHVALELLHSCLQRVSSIDQAVLDKLTYQLEQVLTERFEGHWYPDKPIKGQAFRSLEFNRENQFCDPIFGQVCRDCNVQTSSLAIRHEFTLWIDPYEVSIRLGSPVSPKDNEQFVVAQFDREGNQLIRHDFETILSRTRLSLPIASRRSPTNEIASNDRPVSPPKAPASSMFRNDPLFTPPRNLSPQAPVFEMSAPIQVPSPIHSFENSLDSTDECSSVDENRSQPERSDTPHSMHSTTSNESSDSGYCGYVESLPYYYKLNRLNKALAIQRHSYNRNPTHKHNHGRRPPRTVQHHYQQAIARCDSPPTPTPANINHLAAFYQQQMYVSLGDHGQAPY